jgi:hypothetical protein
MTTVFLVQHAYEQKESHEDVKVIGVYASWASAKSAVARISLQPGFQDMQEGFSVDAYEIDEDHWIEGFVTPYDKDAEA